MNERQLVFGGDLGGPIIKNRTFFFGLLEFNRRREAPDARNATAASIPSPAGYAALQSLPLGPGQTQASRQAVLSALSFLPQIYPQVGNYDNITTTNVNGIPIQVGTMRLPLANKVAERKCVECHDIDNSPDFHDSGAFEKYWKDVEHKGKD